VLAIGTLGPVRLVRGGAGGSKRSVLRRALAEEVRALQALSSCRSVVLLEEHFTSNPDGEIWARLEFLKGGDLRGLVVRHGAATLPQELAQFILAELLAGLRELHQHGWMHRDVKEEHIGLTAPINVGSWDCRVKLLDFKSAAEISPGERLHETVGTLGHCAPEVLDGAYDDLADCWSAGVVAYRILLGRDPFCKRSDCPLSLQDKIRSWPQHLYWPPGMPEQPARFLRGLLVEREARMSSAEAAGHPWLLEVQSLTSSRSHRASGCLISPRSSDGGLSAGGLSMASNGRKRRQSGRVRTRVEQLERGTPTVRLAPAVEEAIPCVDSWEGEASFSDQHCACACQAGSPLFEISVVSSDINLHGLSGVSADSSLAHCRHCSESSRDDQEVAPEKELLQQVERERDELRVELAEAEVGLREIELLQTQRLSDAEGAQRRINSLEQERDMLQEQLAKAVAAFERNLVPAQEQVFNVEQQAANYAPMQYQSQSLLPQRPEGTPRLGKQEEANLRVDGLVDGLVERKLSAAGPLHAQQQALQHVAVPMLGRRHSPSDHGQSVSISGSVAAAPRFGRQVRAPSLARRPSSDANSRPPAVATPVLKQSCREATAPLQPVSVLSAVTPASMRGREVLREMPVAHLGQRLISPDLAEKVHRQLSKQSCQLQTGDFRNIQSASSPLLPAATRLATVHDCQMQGKENIGQVVRSPAVSPHSARALGQKVCAGPFVQHGPSRLASPRQHLASPGCNWVPGYLHRPASMQTLITSSSVQPPLLAQLSGRRPKGCDNGGLR